MLAFADKENTRYETMETSMDRKAWEARYYAVSAESPQAGPEWFKIMGG